MKETKVESIVVLIRGKRHELTIAEAQQLQYELNKLLSPPAVIQPWPIYIEPMRPAPVTIGTGDSTRYIPPIDATPFITWGEPATIN